MQQLAGRKRFNLDVVVTEFANRTAQRAPVDKEFCSRSKRAFDWALSPQVTTVDAGAAAVRSRPRDERLSLPRAVRRAPGPTEKAVLCGPPFLFDAAATASI